MLGGVTQMLFSPKSAQSVERPENRPSYSFDGAVNTTAQGSPVSVLYGGPLIVGSQVVSAGLSVEQI
jgi:predicted phage tail protein